MGVIVKPENRVVIKERVFDFDDIWFELTKNLSSKHNSVINSLLAYMIPWRDRCGKKIKAVARCSQTDEWDEEFGRKLAEAKYQYKRHKKLERYAFKIAKELRELTFKMMEVGEFHHQKASKIHDDIDSYFMNRKGEDA